jgi:hypothetical protein
MRTLTYYLEKEKISNGDVRYFPDYLLDDLAKAAFPCTGEIREQLEWIRSKRTSYPACSHCGKTLTSHHWDLRFLTYREYCNKTCAAKARQSSAAYKQTNRDKYGVDHPFSSQAVQNKRISTNLEKYGRTHPHPWNSTEYSEIIQNKHGVSCVRHINGVNEKIVNSILANTRTEFLEKLKHINSDYQCLTKLEDLKWISPRSADQVLTWQHKCGKVFESPIIVRDGEIRTRVCPSCSAGTSKAEQQIFEIVSQVYPDAISRERNLIKPLELDIYIPSLNMGIEFDGTYWHSAKFVNEKETQRKFLKCHELGIRLITITESAYILRHNIVMARLCHVLGQSSEKIYARKCELVQLSSDEKNEFFRSNHLDGDARSKVAFGLTHNGILVAAMSFGKSRFSKKHEWEIIRAASKSGVNVVGGVSKLIKNFVKTHNPKSLITYADLEWGVGDSYAQAGMKFSHFTKPGYFYVSKSNEIVTRYQAQKLKLPKLLGENFDPYLTELDNMKNAGYIQVFDKGNAVYELFCQ